MGNQRFKLSDMIPNAWFYKLKYMNTSSSSSTTNNTRKSRLSNKNPNPNPKSPPPSINPSYPSLVYSSYSIPATSLDPPRTSSRRSRRNKPPRRRTVYRPSPLARRHGTSDSDDSTSLSEVGPDSSDEDGFSNPNNLGFSASIPKLPPILTKPMKLDEDKEKNPSRVGKLRSKRIVPRGGRRSVSRSPCVVSFRNKKIANDSVAMAKVSVDPVGDFRDSMEEMITEYCIKDTGDLEDLLACYLSLNSSRFHDHIVRAFEQIWFGIISRHRFVD